MRYFSLDLHDNFHFVLYLSIDQRVFDRNFNNEIFQCVFICVSLQSRNVTLGRIDKSCFEVLFISDQEIKFECATLKNTQH